MAQSPDPVDRTTPRLLALLALGVLVLMAVVGAVAQARTAQQAGLTAVDAVVVDDRSAARAAVGTVTQEVDGGVAPPEGPTRVAWRAADGRTVVATVALAREHRAGETVRLWTRPDGSVAPPPDGDGPAVLALVAGTGTAAAVLAAHRSARSRARSRELTREWALVEPAWRRSTLDG